MAMVSRALLNWRSMRRASRSVCSVCAPSVLTCVAAPASASDSAALRSASRSTRGCLPSASRRMRCASARTRSASCWRRSSTSASSSLTLVPTQRTLAAAWSRLALSRSMRGPWLSSSWSSRMISLLSASASVWSSQRPASAVAGPASAGGGSWSWVAMAVCRSLASARRWRISAGRPASSARRCSKSARRASTAARSAFSFCNSCSTWLSGSDGSTARLSSGARAATSSVC
jgi:hypothetical protein